MVVEAALTEAMILGTVRPKLPQRWKLEGWMSWLHLPSFSDQSMRCWSFNPQEHLDTICTVCLCGQSRKKKGELERKLGDNLVWINFLSYCHLALTTPSTTHTNFYSSFMKIYFALLFLTFNSIAWICFLISLSLTSTCIGPFPGPMVLSHTHPCQQRWSLSLTHNIP